MDNIFIKQVVDLPIPFLPRYNIFSGANDWYEWRLVLSYYLKGKIKGQGSQLISSYEKNFAEKVIGKNIGING